MSHMVIYRGADGSPGYHQTDEVHDAVAVVERLRNQEGVEEARIFRMEQVNFEYRPYFRVELTSGGQSLSSAPTAAAVSAPRDSVGGGSGSSSSSASDTYGDTRDDSFESNSEAVEESGDQASPNLIVRSISDGPSPSSSDSDSDNGVGARRGLFGR